MHGDGGEAAKSDDIDDEDGQGVDPDLTEDIDDADVAGAGISDERGSLVGSLVGAEVTHVKLVEMAFKGPVYINIFTCKESHF